MPRRVGGARHAGHREKLWGAAGFLERHLEELTARLNLLDIVFVCCFDNERLKITELKRYIDIMERSRRYVGFSLRCCCCWISSEMDGWRWVIWGSRMEESLGQ